MPKNALVEFLNEISEQGKTVNDISEYHILFSPREKGFNDRAYKDVKGTDIEKLTNFLDMNYETDINFQKLHGWVSFIDGSWLERFFDFDMEYWIFMKRPTIENDREYLKNF